MANELSGNSGYLAIRPETVEGVPVGAGSIFVPLYEESLTTESNPETEMAAFGSKFARYQITPGVRSHGGDLTVMAEPNSTAHFISSLYHRTGISGSAPYTWSFSTQAFNKPKSYTFDISSGSQVFRYAGVQASEISPEWKDGEMRWKLKVSALASFLGAEIASASTSTLTLSTPTAYPNPTNLLVVGDPVLVVNQATGATQSFTISSLTATTVTLSGTPTGVTAGDMLVLAPATPSLSLLQPFLWSRTEFRFGATASAALSATHTPVEDGSEFVLQHAFEDDKGAQSSGSFDPSVLVRSKSTDVTVKIKKFFRGPDEVRNFIGMKKVALVIRMFSGSQYECRITLNNLTITAGGSKPLIKTEETEYYELDYIPSLDTVDGQAFDVKVINNLAS